MFQSLFLFISATWLWHFWSLLWILWVFKEDSPIWILRTLTCSRQVWFWGIVQLMASQSIFDWHWGIYLSIYLSIIYLSIYLSLYLSSIYLSISTCLSIYLSYGATHAKTLRYRVLESFLASLSPVLCPHFPAVSATWKSVSSTSKTTVLCLASPFLYQTKKGLEVWVQGDCWGSPVSFLPGFTVLRCLLSNVWKQLFHLFCPVFSVFGEVCGGGGRGFCGCFNAWFLSKVSEIK